MLCGDPSAMLGQVRRSFGDSTPPSWTRTPTAWEPILQAAKRRAVTSLYSARDTDTTTRLTKSTSKSVSLKGVRSNDVRITQPCIDVKDKSCVDVCPVSCIYLESDDVDRKLYIHPDECIDCGACEPECPLNAIFVDNAVPPEWTEFLDLDRRWNTGDDDAKNAVRARIDEIQPPAA
jgi:ferredoxin